MGSPLSSSPVRGPASPTGFSSGPSWVACTPGPVLILTAVDLNRTGPCPLCWTRCPRPSGRRRESQMEKPVEAQDLHSSTPRLGPGRAARTVAVPTWLCGRSARQHSPGDQERSVFESPHFWSLGLRSRLSEPCLGGGGGVRRAWGPSALVPEGPFLLQCVLRAGPSGRGPWPRGARPTGRLSRAAWCSCQARDSKTRLPGLHPALGNLASTGSDSAKESLLHAPSPHLPVLPFSSGVVVRAQLQCRHVRTLGPEVTRALNAPDPTGHPTPDSGGFARDRVRRL